MMKMFIAFVDKIAEESAEYVPNDEVPLKFVELGYVMSGDIPTLGEMSLEKERISEPGA